MHSSPTADAVPSEIELPPTEFYLEGYSPTPITAANYIYLSSVTSNVYASPAPRTPPPAMGIWPITQADNLEQQLPI